LENVVTRKRICSKGDGLLIPRMENREAMDETSSAGMQACWTCGSCDFECPVNIYTHALRPQKIVRMVNLGMVTELLNTPAIWLCLGCRRCSDCCSQGVDGAKLIQDLRDLALSSGAVDFELKIRMENSFRVVYQYFLREISLILFPSVERSGGLQRQSV